MSIQLFVPSFHVEECLAEIRECLEKGWTGLGYKTIEFEAAWNKYTGHRHSHFLNSATAGLNLAFDVMKEHYQWNDGDEIITTPLTFVSSNHAILLAGLHAVFADIDDTLCLDPANIAKKITPRTKAVLYVGIGGNCGNFQEIVSLCKKHGLQLILDAAHMTGTRLNGQMPGLQADVTVYSYQAVKNLPTADSGMICFQDNGLDEITRKKTWLGISKDTYARTNEKGNYKWKYDVEYVGYKYHGNSIMAAIALVQLKYVDRDNAFRRQIAHWYRELLSPIFNQIQLVEIEPECESSSHLFQILVDDRDGLMLYLNKNQIFPGVHYIDNTQYRMYAYAKNTCCKAAYASDHLISLPMHLNLTREHVLEITKTIKAYLQK